VKIWILGAGGQLGRALIDQCQFEGIRFVATTRKELDITDLEAVKRAAESLDITHVINCAAFTDVDGAEINERQAYDVNSAGPENLGAVCRQRNLRVVHVSTDYVFDGRGDRPYKEEDPPNPINIYGKSKLEGEHRLIDQIPTACIVRTSWVFGRSGNNFISSVFDKLLNHPHIDAVADQKGKATYNRDLARALIDLSAQSGIYHFANSEEMSRYEILKDFFQSAKARGVPIKCQTIAPISSSIFPSASKRPKYSVLDTGKITRALGRKPRVWKTVLNEYLDLIAQGT